MFIDPTHLEEVQKEFKTASDRAVAILATSFLDNLLKEILTSFLVPVSNKQETLFNSYAPLSTFSGKIELTYRLGLISKEEHRLLHIVRSVRNSFAHDMGVSFNSENIAKKCGTIKLPLRLAQTGPIPFPKQLDQPAPLPQINKADTKNHRALFEECVMFLFYALAGRGIGLEQSHTPADFLAISEPMRRIALVYDESLKRLDALWEQRQKKLGLSPSADEQEEYKRWDLLRRIAKYTADKIDEAHAALEKSSDSKPGSYLS